MTAKMNQGRIQGEPWSGPLTPGKFLTSETKLLTHEAKAYRINYEKCTEDSEIPKSKKLKKILFDKNKRLKSVY